ncbi:MAG: hypothetical protein AAF515_05200 [Pseudomonadota bacterium]
MIACKLHLIERARVRRRNRFLAKAAGCALAVLALLVTHGLIHHRQAGWLIESVALPAQVQRP